MKRALEKELIAWKNRKEHLPLLLLEVKAGSTGTLRSLHQLMKSKQIELGIRISEHNLFLDGQLLSVPFYLTSTLDRFV